MMPNPHHPHQDARQWHPHRQRRGRGFL